MEGMAMRMKVVEEVKETEGSGDRHCEAAI